MVGFLLSDQEIKEALYTHKGEYWVGAGKDAVHWKHRKVEDRNPPFCLFSPDCTVNEEYHYSMCVAYLKEPLLDGFCAPILEDSIGQKIRSASPLEINGCTQHIYNLRLAAKQVGRPGTFFVAVGTAEHDSGQISVSNNEWGVRTTDTRILGTLTEFKTADTLLNRVVHCAQYGCYTGNLTGPIYGGWCGGAEGVAVALIAYSLNGRWIYGAIFNQHFPFHLNWGSNTTRELLWPIVVAGQALGRNSKLLYTSNGFSNAGPMTDMVFYETACHALVSTVTSCDLIVDGVAHGFCINGQRFILLSIALVPALKCAVVISEDYADEHINDALTSVSENPALQADRRDGQGLLTRSTQLPLGMKSDLATEIPHPEAFLQNFLQVADIIF